MAVEDISEEEIELLSPLNRFFVGVVFEGSNIEEAKAKRCEYYRPIVTGVFDLPLEEPSEDDLVLYRQCAVCGCRDGNFEWSLVEPQDAERLFKLSGANCRFDEWALGNHLFHYECFAAGCFDSITMGSGMSSSREKVTIQANCLNRKSILNHFEVLNGGTEDIKLVPKFGERCPFCVSMELGDDESCHRTEQLFRQMGFREEKDSARIALGLCKSGSCSPFPTGGTVYLRPHFSKDHTEILLRHAVVGTILDYDGYRAMNLHIVKQDPGELKGTQRLAFDDAGYAIVPARFIAQHGFVFFLGHTNESLKATFHGSLLLQEGQLEAFNGETIFAMNESSVELDIGNGSTDPCKSLTESRIKSLDRENESDKAMVDAVDSIENWLCKLEKKVKGERGSEEPPKRDFPSFLTEPIQFVEEFRKRFEEWKNVLFCEEGMELLAPTTDTSVSWQWHPLFFDATNFADDGDKDDFKGYRNEYNKFLKRRARTLTHYFDGNVSRVQALPSASTSWDLSGIPDIVPRRVLFFEPERRVERDGTLSVKKVPADVLQKLGFVACKNVSSILGEEMPPLQLELPNSTMPCSKNLVVDGDRVFLNHDFVLSREDVKRVEAIQTFCAKVIEEAISSLPDDFFEETSGNIYTCRDGLMKSIYNVLVESHRVTFPTHDYDAPFCQACSSRIPRSGAWELIHDVSQMHRFYSGEKLFKSGPSVRLGKDYLVKEGE